jgi:lipoteichoic acid synthase
VLKLRALEGTGFGNYLHTMHFFDQALEDLKGALARDGLLDDTLLVVFGDHDAGFARDAALARTIGIESGAAAWILNDRIPLFIRAGTARTASPDLIGARAIPAGQTDLAPTLLALMGIDPVPLPYLGRNLLGAGGDGPVPRPYGDWLDASHLFLAGEGDASCFDLAGHHATSASACAEENTRARRVRDLSRLIVIDDVQQELRRRLAVAAPQ